MSRRVRDIELNKPVEFVTFIMEDYLRKYRFQKVRWKRKEWVYRSPYDIIDGQYFLKWSYQNEVLHLETWYYGNFGFEHANRAPSTRHSAMHPFESSLMELFQVLKQEHPEYAAMNQAMAVTEPDYELAATLSVLLGGLGFTLLFSYPPGGIAFGLAGFFQGKKGLASSKFKRAWAGIIGNFILLVLSFIYTVIMLVSG